MKLIVNWSVSEECGEKVFELEDVGCKTVEEWNDLSLGEKHKRLRIAFNDLLYHPHRDPVKWAIV